MNTGRQPQTSDAKTWPLYAALACMWSAVLILLLASLSRNDWQMLYPLDDTYIHMAIAKNLVAHHIWGVTRYGFSWSTSSPLWTALLASAYWVGGIRISTPLVLNAILATALCVFAWFIFARRAELNPRETFVALLALIFLTSIASITMVAMEHVLQLLTVCAFIYLASKSLTGARDKAPLALIAIAPLVSTARYEGLFLIVPAVCLFAIRRRYAVAAVILIAAAVPVTALGLWAMSHGWHFLPSSLIVKGNLPAHMSPGAALIHFLSRPAVNLLTAPWLLVLGLAAAVAFYRSLELNRTIWTWPSVALAMYLAMLAADITLSRTGILWYSRYDAYLVGSAVFIFACCWHDPAFVPIASMFRRDASIRARVATAVIAIVLLSRAVLTTIFIPAGTNILYRQQYQLARLLGDYYSGQSVALNDIGVAAYMTDVRITDLAGLATVATADVLRANDFALPAVERICSAADVKIAVVYRQVFAQGIPLGWIEVGSDGVLKSLSVGGPQFVFYGVDQQQADLLRARLAEFKRNLPVSLQSAAGDSEPMARR